MIRYKDKYRVSYNFSADTGELLKDDTFIVCKRRNGFHGQIYRYNSNTLAYYIPCRIRLDLDKLNFINYYYQTASDTLIYFKEEYLDNFITMFPVVKGSKISPRSKRNLRFMPWWNENKKQEFISKGII